MWVLADASGWAVGRHQRPGNASRGRWITTARSSTRCPHWAFIGTPSRPHISRHAVTGAARWPSHRRRRSTPRRIGAARRVSEDSHRLPSLPRPDGVPAGATDATPRCISAARRVSEDAPSLPSLTRPDGIPTGGTLATPRRIGPARCVGEDALRVRSPPRPDGQITGVDYMPRKLAAPPCCRSSRTAGLPEAL